MARHRQHAKPEILHFAVTQCSLGTLLAAASERGLCAILMGDDPALLVQDLQQCFSSATLTNEACALTQNISHVAHFINTSANSLDLPLDIRGSDFQQRVWQALCDIPAGTTASYQDIARRLGMPKAARAIARACAANTLAVVIPCHRVVRQNGAPGGYRWGIERKQQLLAMESTRNPQAAP